MNRWIQKANTKLSIGGAAGLLVIVALGGQLLGFFRTRLISANFSIVDAGTTDAFFAAFQITDFFFYTIAAGALGVAFMPFLADHLERGDREGLWELVTSLLNLLAVVMTVISLVIFVFAEPLINLVTSAKLDPDHMTQAVTIMRFISLSPLLFTLSGILTSVQQTFGRFFFFAVAPLFYNLSIIVSAVVFSIAQGNGGGPGGLGIKGLGIGALVGGILQLLIACLGLIGLGFKWKPKIMWGKDFKRILRQLPPRSIDQGIDQINSIVETNRAAHLGAGPITYYNYALTLMNVPVYLIGTSIATAAFPRLTERLAQNRSDLFRKDFLSILRTMVWISMPVLVICFFCRAYLARLITGDVAPEVALIFGFLIVAIFFRIVYSIMSRYFYAQKDTKTPLFVSIFAIALNIYLAFTLARPDSYGIAGLALAQSAVAFSEVMVLMTIMIIRDHRLLNMEFWGAIGRILSVTGFSVLAAFVMISIFPLGILDRGLVTLGTKLGSITIVTLLVHVGISYIMGLEEAESVVQKAKKVILRPIKVDF